MEINGFRFGSWNMDGQRNEPEGNECHNTRQKGVENICRVRPDALGHKGKREEKEDFLGQAFTKGEYKN